MVLDTNVFIYLFENAPPYAPYCEYLIEKAEAGIFSGVVTPVTAAEIIVKPLQEKRPDLADKYLLALRSMKNMHALSMSFAIGGMAGALRAKYGKPLPDMIQVAFALQAARPAMVTNDKAMRAIKEVDLFLLDDLI